MATSRYAKLILLLFVFCSFSLTSPEPAAGRYKLILFEGSDWCVNCMRLEKNVLSDTAFIEFLELQQIEIERIDFPQRKKLDKKTQAYNASMAEKFDFKGIFPTIILVKAFSEEIIPLNYHDQNPRDFMQQIKSNIKD